MPPTDGFSTAPPCLSSLPSLPTHHCNITPLVAQQIPLRSWAATLGGWIWFTGSQGHGHIAPRVRACLSSGSTPCGRTGPGYPKVVCPFCKSPFPPNPLAPPQPYGFPRSKSFHMAEQPPKLSHRRMIPYPWVLCGVPGVNRRSHCPLRPFSGGSSLITL